MSLAAASKKVSFSIALGGDHVPRSVSTFSPSDVTRALTSAFYSTYRRSSRVAVRM